MKQKKDNRIGLIIFFAALLTVYAVITLALGVLFEYNTVRVSRGEIIFSAVMSWQLILFLIELVTIILQLIMLIKIIGNKGTVKALYRSIIRYSGMAAGGSAAVTVLVLLFTDGPVINPTGVFAIYMILILAVRTILLPVLTNRDM